MLKVSATLVPIQPLHIVDTCVVFGEDTHVGAKSHRFDHTIANLIAHVARNFQTKSARRCSGLFSRNINIARY